MQLLTAQETAKSLRLPVTAVRRYIATGQLPAVRIGRRMRVREESLERLLKPVKPARAQ